MQNYRDEKGEIIKKQQENYGLKKHASQMTKVEKDFLIKKFFEVPKESWNISAYCISRFEERNIDHYHFLTLWTASDLIEFHHKYNCNRILLRSNFVRYNYQVCAVFDLTTRTIVTVYKNHIQNKHDDLRLEFYNAELDILSFWKDGE